MNHKAKRILTLIMLAALLLSLPVIGASAADLTFEDGKVTNSTALSFIVGPNSDQNEFFTDIKTAKVQVDLYKVADAVQETGGHGSMYVYDNMKYGLTGLDTYDALKALTNDDWRSMAQNAANTLFALSTLPTPDYTFTSAETGTVGPQNVDAGLYLVIAHGSDLAQADYVVKDGSNVSTIANSDIYVYTYTPELISLPTTVDEMGVVVSPTSGDPYTDYNTYVDADGKTQTGVSTAGGDWKASLTAMLKPVREYRFGRLVLQKTVPAIEEHSDATFVFHVVGMLTRNGNTSKVYDDYLSITFGTNDGGKTILYHDPVTNLDYIELPVGTVITAEEVYTGSCYQLDSLTMEAGGKSANTIPVPYDAEGKELSLVVTAVNSYKPNDIHIGYGIQNTFEQNGESWLWYKDGVLQNGGTK